MKASWGTSTRPIAFIRFLPLASTSLRMTLMLPLAMMRLPIEARIGILNFSARVLPTLQALRLQMRATSLL